MDPIALTFYAAICGVLALASPALGGMVQRLIAGAATGLIAAAVLPFLKAALAG